MGFQIIRQPDAWYALYCSNTGTIAIWDATADEIVHVLSNRAKDQAAETVRATIERLDAGTMPRPALTWGKALSRDRLNGGQAHACFPDPDGT